MPWKKKVIDLEWKNLRVCTINSLSHFITGEIVGYEVGEAGSPLASDNG